MELRRSMMLLFCFVLYCTVSSSRVLPRVSILFFFATWDHPNCTNLIVQLGRAHH